MTTADEELAQHIAAAIKDHPHAEVRINPNVAAIPPNIANNLLVLLERVQCTGLEAIAWGEAYHYVQQFVPPKMGVPFTGLPPAPTKPS